MSLFVRLPEWRILAPVFLLFLYLLCFCLVVGCRVCWCVALCPLRSTWAPCGPPWALWGPPGAPIYNPIILCSSQSGTDSCQCNI